MTLVPNHPQRLNGNNFLWFVLSAMILASCASQKSTVITDPQIVDEEKPEERPLEPKDIDTIEWEVVDESIFPPILSEDDGRPGIFKKSVYNISLLLPLESDLGLEPPGNSNLRFINYYGGMQLALKELESDDFSLNVNVYDTERDSRKLDEILGRFDVRNSDLIIGPYARDNVRMVAEFAKDQKIPMVSPWQSSKRITGDNPYYIQLRPNLNDHYYHLLDHALASFDAERLILLGREVRSDENRFALFQQANNIIQEDGDADPIPELKVEMDSLLLADTLFHHVINNDGPTVFIIPNWSFGDEEFIYHCLRKLNVERRDRQVYIYGMPIMLDSDKISFDYYRNLNLRVVRSKFVDLHDPSIKGFKKRYYEEFGDLPMEDAYAGYDVMRFLALMLNDYGTSFQYYFDKSQDSYLQTTFQIQRSDKDKQFVTDDLLEFDYFVNKHLDIIQYVDNKFARLIKG